MPRKIDVQTLDDLVFSRTGADDDRVHPGPAVGEDAAGIECPGGTLVVSSDPISMAASNIGRLAVPIACNDVAASGAVPSWMSVIVLLPQAELLEGIVGDLDATARSTGVAIVGGHTEVNESLERPHVGITAFGITDRFVSTADANPGDRILLSKAAGIEGTAILAADFGDQLDVPAETVSRANEYLSELFVGPEARILKEHATSMHDPTEGGILGGVLEMAFACDNRIVIDPDRIPVRQVTRELCKAADVDPYRIFGSGSLLAAVSPDAVERSIATARREGIEVTEIGTVEEGPASVDFGERHIDTPIEDDMYTLWQ